VGGGFGGQVYAYVCRSVGGVKLGVAVYAVQGELLLFACVFLMVLLSLVSFLSLFPMTLRRGVCMVTFCRIVGVPPVSVQLCFVPSLTFIVPR
jgi:hypothetical protein